MAKIPQWRTAFLLLAFLAIADSASAAPTPKPEPAPHAGPSSNAEITPTPRPEPPKAGPDKPRTASRPAATAKPSPKKTARKASPAPRRTVRRPARAYAGIPLPPRSWKDHGHDALDAYRERGAVSENLSSGFPAFREERCGEACVYREWLERYRAWYDRYGPRYGAPQPGAWAPDQTSAHAAAPPPRAPLWRNREQLESERARLDPWHGYNARDGLGNGY
jgi:hypothetical protein